MNAEAKAELIAAELVWTKLSGPVISDEAKRAIEIEFRVVILKHLSKEAR